MKKILSIVMLFFSLSVGSTKKESYAQYVNKSYIVLDALDNKTIEGNNIHIKRSVASVSKIMTAIVAIENGNLEKTYVIEREDTNTYGSSIYLKEGETISLLDLLYGLMLRSGNDAAKAIARIVGGNVEQFIIMMNNKAKDIGMTNTIFNNPSGLDIEEDGNISTSYDLALLMSYAIKNDVFNKIVSTKYYSIDGHKWKNKNKLLFSYNKLIGGKTGFTDKAKRTLVTAARDKLTTFIIVTLDCGNDFNFHRFLYERNFQKYETIKLLDKGESYHFNYKIYSENVLSYTIEKEFISEYKMKYIIDDNVARIVIFRNNHKETVGKVSVEKIEVKQRINIINTIKNLFS